MNHPNGRSSRRDMISRLGESTANMLDFGSHTDTPTTTNASHIQSYEDVEFGRVRRSPARAQPPLRQLARDRPLHNHKMFSSPAKKPSRSAPVSADKKGKGDTAESKSASSKYSPIDQILRDICLPALEVNDADPERMQSPRREYNPQRDHVGAFAPEITSPPRGRKPPRSRSCEEPVASEKVASPPQRRSSFRAPMNIDIGESMSVPLAGSEETVRALHQDRCINTACADCETFLYCIETATMVLCPECRSVSPISSEAVERNEAALVGLGLTVELVVAEYSCLSLE